MFEVFVEKYPVRLFLRDVLMCVLVDLQQYLHI